MLLRTYCLLRVKPTMAIAATHTRLLVVIGSKPSPSMPATTVACPWSLAICPAEQGKVCDLCDAGAHCLAPTCQNPCTNRFAAIHCRSLSRRTGHSYCKRLYTLVTIWRAPKTCKPNMHTCRAHANCAGRIIST